MTRTDDVINVAGHRLATGAVEEVLASYPDVAECPDIGVADPVKGQVPLGFVLLKAGVPDARHGDIVAEVVQLVRDHIGPVAAFKTALVVTRLPKTRSGEILPGTMRKIADAQAYQVPATIEDPATLGGDRGSASADELTAARNAGGNRVIPRHCFAAGHSVHRFADP
jgi:propionyl-CoA synthetase